MNDTAAAAGAPSGSAGAAASASGMPGAPGGANRGNPFESLVDFFDAARRTALHDRLVSACYAPIAPAPPGPHLDVGCGAGVLVARSIAVGRTAVGTDLSLGMCRRARLLEPRASFAVAAFEHLPFATGAFVGLTAMLVLHLADGKRAMAEAARVLRPGGVVSLVTQSTAWTEATARALVDQLGVEGTEREFYIGSARSGEANRRYAPEELTAELAAHGFRDAVIRTECAGGLLIAHATRR